MIVTLIQKGFHPILALLCRFWEVSCKRGGEGINQKLFSCTPSIYCLGLYKLWEKNMSHRFATPIFVTGLPKNCINANPFFGSIKLVFPFCLLFFCNYPTVIFFCSSSSFCLTKWVAKGGLISESFSLWLESQINAAKMCQMTILSIFFLCG